MHNEAKYRRHDFRFTSKLKVKRIEHGTPIAGTCYDTHAIMERASKLNPLFFEEENLVLSYSGRLLFLH